MADDTDDSQKTEEPSWRKLDEARSKGQVPQSREVTNWFVIMGSTLSMVLFAPGIAGAMRHAMMRFFEHSGDMRLDGTFRAVVLGTIGDIAVALIPALLFIMAMGLAAPVLQTGIIFAPDKLIPKFEHLSPGKGMARIFSVRALLEFLKGLLKMAVVGGIAAMLLLPEIDRLALLPSM